MLSPALSFFSLMAGTHIPIGPGILECCDGSSMSVCSSSNSIMSTGEACVSTCTYTG